MRPTTGFSQGNNTLSTEEENSKGLIRIGEVIQQQSKWEQFIHKRLLLFKMSTQDDAC